MSQRIHKRDFHSNSGVKKHRFGLLVVIYDILFAASASLRRNLPSEAVQGAALSLQCVHDIKSSHGLATSVLSVGHSVTDDVLKEDLQNTSGLLVDEAGDALHATSARQSADGRLGDALDVVSQDLSVSLGPALAQSLSSFSSAGHFDSRLIVIENL